MSVYLVRLGNKREIAEKTFILEFKKPAGFEFQAGQYVNLELIDFKDRDGQGASRFFSIASAPAESNLSVVFRAGESDFKKKLENLSVGDEVRIKEPVGNLILPAQELKDVVFLVGGVGVAPARSIIYQAFFENRRNKFILFYSNRRPEDAAFLEDFSAIKKNNFVFVPTMTQTENSNISWSGECGYIDETMLKKHVPDLKTPVYFIVGTPRFVSGMKDVLSFSGVGKENIITDEFSGYR